MGIILDSSIAIAAQRRKLAVEDLLAEIRGVIGGVEIALSVVSVMELEHGIWRAQDGNRANRRRRFLEDLLRAVPVYPITVELARRAGRVDADLQEKGIRVALELGYGVGTANLRDFERIPGLFVVEL